MGSSSATGLLQDNWRRGGLSSRRRDSRQTKSRHGSKLVLRANRPPCATKRPPRRSSRFWPRGPCRAREDPAGPQAHQRARNQVHLLPADLRLRPRQRQRRVGDAVGEGGRGRLPAGLRRHRRPSSTAATGDHEDSLGQLELNFLFDRAIRTADNVSTYRQICAAVARKHGVIASFMPKPFTGVSANGAHHHFTLVDENGANVFYDAEGPAKLSEIGRQFMGGILEHYRALCAIGASTVNSYKRFWDFGFWAPIYKDYGWQNRTCLVRCWSSGVRPTLRRTLVSSMRRRPRRAPRDLRPRQLPTVPSHAVPTRECQSDPPSLPRAIHRSQPRAQPPSRASPLDVLIHVIREE
jgi:hypothetical protein